MRIKKPVGTLRFGMTDAISVSYNNRVWETPEKIGKRVESNYETVVYYDRNYLQKKL